MLTELIQQNVEALNSKIEELISNTIKSAIGEYDINQISNRIKSIRYVDAKFYRLFLDDKPLIEIYDMETSERFDRYSGTLNPNLTITINYKILWNDENK